jgi:hypothetical protein
VYGGPRKRASVYVVSRADIARFTADGWSDVNLGYLAVSELDRDEAFKSTTTDPRPIR